MEKIYILLVEDQREVLQAIAKDLQFFEDIFAIEECESAEEAKQLMHQIDMNGDFIACVISDHVMPRQSGVDFLIGINADDRFRNTRKILLTGLATHHDTIRAINSAAINKYLEKPWLSAELVNTVKKMLTEFILEKGINYQPYIAYLDQPTLLDHLRKNN